MPEGPEIRLAADRIEKAIAGKPLQRVVFHPHALADYGDELEGCSIERIDTRGKAMLTRFDNGLVMYSHNQLYGRWYVNKLPTEPKTKRSLRVLFETDTHAARLYSATDIDIFHESEVIQHPFLRNVGPDALDDKTTPAVIAKRLRSKDFRNRGLANFYLDQGFVAGIGNYLRSEILWCAKVSPSARPGDLSDDAVKRLARETKKICKRAYTQRGVTVTKTLANRLKKDGYTYRQYRHYAYGREHEPCYECGSEIRRTNFASRRLYYCPSCQAD